MSTVNRPLVAALVGILLVIPIAIVGDAVGFGSLAWIVAILAIGFIVSLIDREGFYGPRSGAG